MSGKRDECDQRKVEHIDKSEYSVHVLGDEMKERMVGYPIHRQDGEADEITQYDRPEQKETVQDVPF